MGELTNSPVVEWLNRGLMAVWRPKLTGGTGPEGRCGRRSLRTSLRIGRLAGFPGSRLRTESAGIFSQRTNRAREAWVYSHDGPIRRTAQTPMRTPNWPLDQPPSGNKFFRE
eukprot:3086146-Pyramimonas_sp.AAC.1